MTVSCDRCGACCMEMESPPGYQLHSMAPPDDPDKVRFDNLPQEPKQSLLEYYQKGQFEVAPCIWLNTETRRCRYYEHRPSICREFEVGSGPCLMWRQMYYDATRVVPSVEGP